ncbi:MAG: FKBP-type peptidyl-prolyl cis-trans isomerase [Pseudolysinimonas sp.]|uniref:FKBP-type peptidyl-prolyl cis-trans isomerase n=1 Tax=Pseudolysinimonas sp. TaxID=2680009 RepID=UPI0032651BB1
MRPLNHRLLRRLPIASFTLAAALVLAGCAGTPAPAGSATPTTTSVATADICDTAGGAGVDAVTVTGAFGSAPNVTFATPLTVDTTQRTIVIDGGKTVAPGANVEVAYTLINGTTGATIDAGGYDGTALTQFRASLDTLRAGFVRTLACVGPGSRVVGVIPPAEGFGSDATDSGVGADDSIVFVADVVNDLSPAVWTTDLPTIGGSATAPVLTLPATAPKADLELAVLTQGDGAVVGPTDSVTVNYLGMKWEDGQVFDESFSKSPATFSVTKVVDGFAAALIGQKVGSRVLVTMPPALGYGLAGSSTNALAGFTLVFLIDIQATKG